MTEEPKNPEPPKSETFTLVVGEPDKVGMVQTLSSMVFPVGNKVNLMAMTFPGNLNDYLLQGIRSGLINGDEVLSLACWGLSEVRKSYSLAAQAMNLYQMVGGNKEEIRKAIDTGWGPDVEAVKLDLVPFMETILANEEKLIEHKVTPITIAALRGSLEKWKKTLAGIKEREAAMKAAKEQEAAAREQNPEKIVNFPPQVEKP